MLGGPLGERPIKGHRLNGSDAAVLCVGMPYAQESQPRIDANGVLQSLLVIAPAIAISGYLNDFLHSFGMTLPAFVTALFVGIVLSNVVPLLAPGLPWPAGTPSLALISEIALGLFLAISLMSLNLATLADAAVPLLLVLAVQVAVCWVLVAFVLFRLLGRSYDPAVRAAGFFGLALGATPTAIAIMTAITKAHGASPRSFLVVPLVGAFFVDIANAFVLQGFIQWLGGR